MQHPSLDLEDEALVSLEAQALQALLELLRGVEEIGEEEDEAAPVGETAGTFEKLREAGALRVAKRLDRAEQTPELAALLRRT